MYSKETYNIVLSLILPFITSFQLSSTVWLSEIILYFYHIHKFLKKIFSDLINNRKRIHNCYFTICDLVDLMEVNETSDTEITPSVNPEIRKKYHTLELFTYLCTIYTYTLILLVDTILYILFTVNDLFYMKIYITLTGIKILVHLGDVLVINNLTFFLK